MMKKYTWETPEAKELLSVGVRAGLKKDRCESLIEEVCEKFDTTLIKNINKTTGGRYYE